MLFLLQLEQQNLQWQIQKIYVPVATLPTEDNIELLERLEYSFKEMINWNKYQSKVIEQAQNRYLDYLIQPNFQGVNRLFILSFENKDDTNVHTRYFFPRVEINDYNVMVEKISLINQ